MGNPTPEGYYFVHSCSGEHTDESEWDACNGRFAWADSASLAVLRSKCVEREGPVLAEREPDADAHRAVLGDVFSPWKRHSEAEARALREIGWTSDPDRICEECCLGDWVEVPESETCPSCALCRECRATSTDESDECLKEAPRG